MFIVKKLILVVFGALLFFFVSLGMYFLVGRKNESKTLWNSLEPQKNFQVLAENSPNSGFSYFFASAGPFTLIKKDKIKGSGASTLEFGFSIKGQNRHFKANYFPCQNGKTERDDLSFESLSIGKTYTLSLYGFEQTESLDDVDVPIECRQEWKKLRKITSAEISNFFVSTEQINNQREDFQDMIIIDSIYKFK